MAKKFRITADAIFEAEDIDDAFAKLSDYFLYLTDTDLYDPQLIESGNIDIKKVEK